MTAPPDPLGRLRRLCLALPGATERTSHGEPTWFVRAGAEVVLLPGAHLLAGCAAARP